MKAVYLGFAHKIKINFKFMYFFASFKVNVCKIKIPSKFKYLTVEYQISM